MRGVPIGGHDICSLFDLIRNHSALAQYGAVKNATRSYYSAWLSAGIG